MRYCVIGTPIAHSGSPALFADIFKQRGLNHTYVINEIADTAALASFFDEMRRGLWAGCNVTMPWKTEAVRYLDELTDTAFLTDAVNTVAVRDGKLFGHSTDGIGMANAIIRATGAPEVISGSNILVLGCGGAARSVIAQLALMNAASITVTARSGHNLELTAELFDRLSARSLSSKLMFTDHNDGQAVLAASEKADIIINCTPVGMDPNLRECPLPEEALSGQKKIVADAVYKTENTRLLELATSSGCVTVTGRSMLHEQALAGASFFFD